MYPQLPPREKPCGFCGSPTLGRSQDGLVNLPVSWRMDWLIFGK
jgi:hypothetical protein